MAQMASGDESARCSGGVAIDPSKLVVTTSRFDVSQIQQIAGSVNKEFLVLERKMLSRDAKFSALPSPSPASFSPAPPRFDLLRFMRVSPTPCSEPTTSSGIAVTALPLISASYRIARFYSSDIYYITRRKRHDPSHEDYNQNKAQSRFSGREADSGPAYGGFQIHQDTFQPTLCCAENPETERAR